MITEFRNPYYFAQHLINYNDEFEESDTAGLSFGYNVLIPAEKVELITPGDIKTAKRFKPYNRDYSYEEYTYKINHNGIVYFMLNYYVENPLEIEGKFYYANRVSQIHYYSPMFC